jgi:hypothetical protein
MLLPPARMLIVRRCRLALALEPVAAPAAAAAASSPPLAVALELAALLCGQFPCLLDEFAVLGRLGLGRGGVKVLGRAFLAVRLRV